MDVFRLNSREMRALLGTSSDSSSKDKGETLESGVFEVTYNQVLAEYGQDIAESLLEYIRTTRMKS